MIICWDNIENLRFSAKTKKWYNGAGGGYIEMDSCLSCGKPFLSREGKSLFCCQSCANSNKNNPMFGKKHTNKTKDFLRKNIKKSFKTIKDRYNVDNISYLDSIKNKKNQIIINFDNCKNIVNKEGYNLISLSGKNKKAIMYLECKNGHRFNIKWSSYKRGHRCKKCYYIRNFKNSCYKLEDFKLYKKLVYKITSKNYKKFYKKINPENIKRCRSFHLDHKFSIAEGYKQNILPSIIGSFVNLEIIKANKNCSKQDKCSITKEELFNEYYRKA